MNTALSVIRQLIELCRGYDPDFDRQCYYEGPFRLTLEGVPESELAVIAAEFGASVLRSVSFAGDHNSCPTVQPNAYVRVGALSIALFSKTRGATAAEVDTAVASIKRKIAACCLSATDGLATTST